MPREGPSDAVLDFGGKAVRELQDLSRAMSHYGRGSYPCRLSDVAPLESSVLDHTLNKHGGELSLEPGLDGNMLSDLLEKLHMDILCKFVNLYT